MGALPCVVPRDWITPPEYEDVEGELLLDEEEREEFEYDERSRMMRRERERRSGSGRESRKASAAEEEEWGYEVERMGSSGESSRGRRERYTDEEHDEPPRLVRLKDAGGGNVPPAERAPLPPQRK